MALVTTEAIALRRTPFQETSQIAHFLTRDRGRLSLILKGVHRPRDRKGGGVDLLDHCLVTFSARRSRSLPPLVERRVLGHHPALRRRADLMQAGQYLVERVLGLVPEGEPVPAVFRLALAFLEALEAGPPPWALPATVFALDGGLLRMSGFEPVLDRCVICGRVPEGPRLLRCDLVRGGVVCSACRERDDGSFPLSTASARVIHRMAVADPRQLADVRLPREIESDVRRFYQRTTLFLTERPTRCLVLPDESS